MYVERWKKKLYYKLCMFQGLNGEEVSFFGGFKKDRWKVEQDGYQGDEDDFLFSLYPTFKCFRYADNEKSLKNFNLIKNFGEGAGLGKLLS